MQVHSAISNLYWSSFKYLFQQTLNWWLQLYFLIVIIMFYQLVLFLLPFVMHHSQSTHLHHFYESYLLVQIGGLNYHLPYISKTP